MKCPKCRSANPDGAKFCNECGCNFTSPLEATSQDFSFTEKLAKIERYLPEGLTEKILAQKDRIEGERRQVTVMFCDMEGFTPMAEKLGPEETYSLMDHVYELLIHKVSYYEGSVNELTGDGIMALFGAPIALEDAPQRALWCALSIHDAITKFNEQKKGIMPVKMRIGIHTGPVVVGTLGNDLRVQFTAVGNTVNLASRMEGLAESGTTYVTEETYRQTRDHFRFEAIGKKTIKGKKDAIPIYRVLSGNEEMHRLRLGSERMIYSDMVGRDNALDRLDIQVMKAINGEGSIVNIIGEAGIGKSRLVAELKRRDAIKRVNLLEGRAISMGKNLSFHPIIDLLRQWAKIREDDGEAAALGKLETAIRGVCRDDVYEVFPFVATLMGMELSGKYAERIKGIEGEALEKLILKNVRDLLIDSTKLSPLVLVMEDFHWADMSTVELMVSLFRLVETQRILFVNLFRPDCKEVGERVIETIKKKFPVYYVEIGLEPLDEKMSEALIKSILRMNGVHHAVIGQIIERSGGNPFFIEEVVQSFIDEGAVELKNGSFEVTDKMGEIAVPHTINDVLMARLDGLDEKTRNLVKIASVIGRNFFYRVLSNVASTIEDIEGKLSHLKDVQLICERRRMDEIEYLFKHALVQEAAYESIIHRKRKELHLSVARSIEKIFSNRLSEFYGMLAYHFSKAEEMEKSEEYLIKAGEEALKSSASSEALNYYREALNLYLKEYGDADDPEKVAMFHKNIALALYNRGQYDEAVEHFDKALDYYWGKLPKHGISTAFKFLSAIFHLLITLYIKGLKFKRIPTNKDIEAVDLFHKKCKALGTVDPKKFFFEFLYLYKRVTNYDLKDFDLGLEIYMDASSLFSFSGRLFRFSRRILDFTKVRVSKDNAKLFINYDFLETIHNFFEGNWNEIKEYDDDIVNRNLDIGEIWNVSQNLFWHGVSEISQGSFDIAESILRKLDEIIRIYDNDFSSLLKFELHIILLIECRKFDEALNEIENAIHIVQKASFNMYLFDLYSYKAWIYLLKRKMEEAEKFIGHACEIRPKVNAIPIILATFYRTRLEFDLHCFKESIKTRNKSESVEYRRKVKESSKGLLRVSKRAALHRTETYKLKGVYYWIIKKQKKALKMWEKAIKEGEYLGANLELSRTYFEVGKRLLQPESKYKKLGNMTAEAYLEKARRLFEKMGLQSDMVELNRVVGATIKGKIE